MDHRIDRVKFDVNFSEQEEARDLQDKFFSVCRKGLDRALERVLEKYDLAISIENLSIDLGKIPRRDLDHKLLDLVEEKFEEALIAYMEDLQIHHSSEQFQLEALTLFLEKGLKHWSDLENLSLLDLFRQVLARSSESLIRFMVNSRHQLTVVSRIVTLINQDDYASLIAKLRPAEATFIIGFIADVKEVNSISPFSPATSGDQLDDRLRELVLLDLIKDYGSAFNRRMFIERNLQAIAKEFNLSYTELLKHFEDVLSEDIPFNMTSTLPGLIQSISAQYHQQEDRTEEQSSVDQVHIFASLIAINEPLHQRLKETYETTLIEYSGELRSYLLRYTRTADQVKSIVDKLSESQLQKLIEVVEPEEHEYIETYISGAKGIGHEQMEFGSERALHTQIYQVVLSYLLIDRGTRFNQKAFLRYQLLGMSQATGVGYLHVLNLFREALALVGTAMIGTGMLAFLEEFLNEETKKVIDETPASAVEVESSELVTQYLKTGTLPVHLRSQLSMPISEAIRQLLADNGTRFALFEFLEAEKESVLETMVDLKQEEFDMLLRVILVEHWKLSLAQADRFFEKLRSLERKVLYPVAYRKVAFQLLMSSSLKVNHASQPIVSTMHASEVSDLLVYQLQDQLSLPRIIEHPDYENTLEFHGRKEMSFTTSRKRLLLALEDITSTPEAYEKEAIRSAFHKLQESEFETFTLLDHLKLEEVEYLLGNLEKQHLQKLIEQLSVGKWQVLKKSLLLIVKGGQARQVEVAHFFAELLQQRSQSIQQVFFWFSERIEVLELPKYYQEEVREQLHKIKTKLELAGTETDEKKGVTQEHDMLITILLDQDIDTDQKASADALFVQLLKQDPNALFKRLHELSFRSEVVAGYIDKLSAASIAQWIQFETGSRYQEFQVFTDKVEQFIMAVFKVDRSVPISQPQLLVIRLMLANRVGHYALSFEQVLRFYLQEVAEHSAFKYQLVRKWLAQGLKRDYEQFSALLEPRKLAILEEEIRPPEPEVSQVREEEAESEEESPEALSNLKVPNAGLVLIWPFFQRLFSMLDYLNEENVFKSNVEKSRAVRLLQYVSGFDWDDQEYNLTLNKILCGMPFSERMERGLEITMEEVDIVEQMLQGVIQNWPHLGNTSVTGLQESFLRRDGFLEKEEENWTLKVEKKGMDVLIDHMPWSYTSVVLRWMPEAIYVDWR